MTDEADDVLTAFDRLCGVELIELGDDLVRARVEVQDRHKQPAGLVHGGLYATIAESMAVAGTAHGVASDGRSATGLSTQTSFLRPITSDRIEATARPRHRGRSTWVLGGRDLRCARTAVRAQSGHDFGSAAPGLTGAPRPSQYSMNGGSRGSFGPVARSMCVHASATTPSVPGRRARITAPPVAASAGVNGGASRAASWASPGGGCAGAVHQHDIADLERLQQLIV